MKLGRVLVAGSLALLGLLGAGRDAHATLGGDVASIAADEQRLGATRHVQKLASGERHDLELPTGTVVHEYVSAQGAVYAITWRGPRIPDLRELLGSHAAELDRPELRRPGGGHHRLSVTGSDLRIEASGHARMFTGRAWVPSLVASGVDVAALD